MKITELKAENVKRLKAVHITPEGNAIVIGGRNGQGKSSVLDSIMYALGGKDLIADQPVRRGEKGARVELKLGDLIVERRWTEGGGTSLKVTNKDGAAYPSPQAILDRLVGSLSFDPLAFMRLSAKDQAATLRGLVGLDFTAIDERRSAAFAERTAVNREHAAAKATLASTPKHNDAPTARVDVAALSLELKKAMNHNAEMAAIRRGVAQAEQVLLGSESAVASLEKQLVAARKKRDADVKALDAARAAAERSKDIDTESIEERIGAAQATNEMVEANRRHAEQAERVEKHAKRAAELTEAIEKADTEKAKALAGAKFPVAGLSFSDGGVLLGDIPLSQASSAEQLRVSVAMGLALNPKLRVMLVRDGSLLDSESLKALAEQAESADAQVWIERVSTGHEVSVVIEDGSVVAASEGVAA